MPDRRYGAFALAACSVLLLASAPGWARVYRCQDAAGQTVFSSFPCGEGAERLEVKVGSGDDPRSRVPVEPVIPPAAADSEGQPVVSDAAPQLPADQPLSAEQQAYREQARDLQRQAEQRQLELLRAQEQREGRGYASAYSSPSAGAMASQRSSARPNVDEAACARAEANLDSLREQGRRGYSASESRSHRSRVREAKDRVRERCRPR